MTPSVRSALKALVFVLAGIVPALVLALRDWQVSGAEGANLAVLVAGGLAVWFKSNTVDFPAARAVIAIFTVVVDAVVSAWTDKVIDSAELTTIITAFLGAISLYLAGNDNAALKAGANVRPGRAQAGY